MSVTFGQMPIGTAFRYRGTPYRKTALSMAADERGWGNVFQSDMSVVVDGELPVLLSYEPDRVRWYQRLAPAPGQGEGGG